VIPDLKSKPLEDSSNIKIMFSIPKTNIAIIGNAKLLPNVQSNQYSPLKYL
jgi:L-lactate utilization protein LutB